MNEAIAPAPPAIRAVVRTAGATTAYYRAGSGTPVILLSSAGEAMANRPLFRELSRHFRVIAPLSPPAGGAERTGAALSAWLREVIDGLGLVRPNLVAEESFGMAALRFAIAETERVGGVSVVVRESSDPAVPTAVLSDAIEALRQREVGSDSG